MKRIIEITLAGGIIGQPTNDTKISINAELIIDLKDDVMGNCKTIITVNNSKTKYYVLETRAEIASLINA